MTDETNLAAGNVEGTTVETPAVAVDTSTPAAETKTEAQTETKTETVDNSRRAIVERAMEGEPPPQTQAQTTTQAQTPAKPELKPGQTLDPASGRVLDPVKPPRSTPASLREKWTSLPYEFQKYWADREKDLDVRLTATANARKFVDEFASVVAPYEPLLRQAGVTALDAAKDLFEMSHRLNTSNPQQRAHLFFQLMQNFPTDLNALGSLFKNPPPAQQQAQQPVDLAAERQKWEREHHVQQADQSAANAIKTFSEDQSNEFYEDVRDIMGRVIQSELMNPNAGETWPQYLKRVYEFACTQHPDVKSVLEARAAAQQQQQVQPQVQQTQAPAATKPVPSVKPSLSAGTRNQPPKKFANRRELVEWSFNQAEGQ